MSERSELEQQRVFFAAQRRTAHWCRQFDHELSPSHLLEVHQ
jgi:hypothetical protein